MTVNLTVLAGQTSQIFPIGIGATVQVSPGPIGTGYVETTTSKQSDVDAGLSTWSTWAAGAVSATSSDIAGATMLGRLVCMAGVMTVQVGDSNDTAYLNNTISPWKKQVASSLFSNGVPVALSVVGKNFGLWPASPRLYAFARKLVIGKQPADIAVMGDSTGDELTEWVYLLAQSLASGIASKYSVAYRAFSDAAQQYSAPQYISTGPLGRAYVLAGSASTSHRVELTDSAVTSPTGDLDVRFLVDLSGGGFSAQVALGGKFGAAGQRSFRMEVTTGGAIFFEHSADGTAQINRTSTALSAPQLTGPIWLRTTLDVDNGATGNTATFYYSADGTNWTQIGSPDVKAGVTSVFDSTTTLQWMGRGGGSISSIGKDIKLYEMRVYGSLTETALAAWMDAGSIPPRTSMTSIAYNDDIGNAGTISYQASTVVGSPRLCMFNGSVAGQAIAYASNATRFPKLAAGGMDAAYINFGHNEANNNTYRTDYKALTDLIIAKNPDCAITGVLQNRRYSPAGFIEENELRMQQVATFMASQGFDALDFFGVVNQADMKADGIHPEPATGVETRMAAGAYAALAASVARWNVPT